MIGMRRREFIGALAGVAAWPGTTQAQQPAMPVVGFLNTVSDEVFAHLVQTFRRGLAETGHVENRNVLVEYHWSDGEDDRLPTLAHDLVKHGVNVIAATGGARLR
jgi:putative tryptophan/tyrosine transport system substrate-binding protein